MILAIGNSGAYEFAAYSEVVKVLKNHGHDAVLFKQDRCLEGDYLTFEVKNGLPTYHIIIDGEKYAVEDFSAVWYLKPHLPLSFFTDQAPEHHSFIRRQFDEMLRAIWTVFRNKKWLNDQWAILMAENKIYQLQKAAELGFVIPNTVITSDPLCVRRFYEDNSRDIVVKLFASSPILNRVIYTNVVTQQHMDRIDTVRKSPSIFQARIKKAYELRITVVGHKIFPVKIHSQEDEETSLDWRKKPKLNDFTVRMEPTTIPPHIEQQIFLLMRAMNLRFGCIDMIVTPDDQYVFLEINPNGQWYFVQLKTGVQIAEAIAQLLI